MANSNAVGMETPSRLFHDDVVLGARSPVPHLDLSGTLEGLGGGRADGASGAAGGKVSVRLVKTVSEGASPIRRGHAASTERRADVPEEPPAAGAR